MLWLWLIYIENVVFTAKKETKKLVSLCCTKAKKENSYRLMVFHRYVYIRALSVFYNKNHIYRDGNFSQV